ncbi:hypothetical protein BpHYR1_019197 [Brachionus plicatilis]|uniref:Uncharacterized protein n=1 Tax=Brachionus plicatilis TaxID=10195 RepID=A0A3M7S5U2_BRAPC|nr:hypothetical protein BpHYR1_019197 [Brachionus plicatilis]
MALYRSIEKILINSLRIAEASPIRLRNRNIPRDCFLNNLKPNKKIESSQDSENTGRDHTINPILSSACKTSLSSHLIVDYSDTESTYSQTDNDECLEQEF